LIDFSADAFTMLLINAAAFPSPLDADALMLTLLGCRRRFRHLGWLLRYA